MMELPIPYSKTPPATRRLARIQYAEEQGGNCWFCREALSGKPARYIRESKINKRLFPAGMFMHPVHLHHNHNTDMTIGAVHALCNAYLWQFKGE